MGRCYLCVMEIVSLVTRQWLCVLIKFLSFNKIFSLPVMMNFPSELYLSGTVPRSPDVAILKRFKV